jgi:hypothetical protein
VVLGYTGDFKEQGTPSFLHTEFVAGYRKCLTGKTTTQDVERRNVIRRDLGYVARGHQTVVLEVCLTAVGVDIGRENTLGPEGLHGNVEPTYTAEKVNESKFLAHSYSSERG